MRIPYLYPNADKMKIRFISINEPLQKGILDIGHYVYTSYYGTVVCRRTLRNAQKMK